MLCFDLPTLSIVITNTTFREHIAPSLRDKNDKETCSVSPIEQRHSQAIWHNLRRWSDRENIVLAYVQNNWEYVDYRILMKNLSRRVRTLDVIGTFKFIPPELYGNCCKTTKFHNTLWWPKFEKGSFQEQVKAVPFALTCSVSRLCKF